MTAASGTGAAPTGEGPLSLPTGAAPLDGTSNPTPVVEPSPSPTGTLPVEAVPVGDVYRVGDALVVRASDGRWRHLRPCDVAPAPPLGLRPVLRREPTVADLYEGEVEPIATDPVLRGVDLAMGRLIQRDCFTDRTVRVLDELRAEVLGVSEPGGSDRG